MLQDTIQIFEDFVVPEADNLPTLVFQPGGAFQILRIIVMLTAIQFDDQLSLDANEVGYIPADRMLPTELEPIQLPIPNSDPQSLLRLRQTPP